MPQPRYRHVADIVRVHGAERPDAIALHVGDRTITFAELDARSSQVANAFQAAGVISGDRVAFIEKNGAEFFEVVYGLAKLGAVNVAVNWRLAPPEMLHIIEDAGADRRGGLGVLRPHRGHRGPATKVRTIVAGSTNVVLRDVDPRRYSRPFRGIGSPMLHGPRGDPVPAHHARRRETDFSSLRTLVYGASPITDDILVKGMERFGCEFIRVYGLTETTGAITQLEGVDHDPVNRPNCCGRAASRTRGWRCASSTPTARTSRPAAVGELWTRSPQNMAGYWNNPTATAATVTPDGWLKTGDAGYLDDDGYIYLHDRVKDMIVSGGENVYPAEVENVLMTHPDVGDVAVIGVPDEKWGEAVKAVVVPAAGTSPERGGSDRLRPRAAGGLQAAQIGRLRRRAAAQPERQTAQTTAARAVLGGRRAPRPVIVSCPNPARDVIDTDSWRSWPAGCSSGRPTTSARCGSIATNSDWRSPATTARARCSTRASR